MKIILVLLAVIFAAGCVRAPEQQRLSEAAYYKRTMPAGAEQLEVILSHVPRGYAYAIFKFRGECFLQYRYGRAGGMANIRCPK